MATTRERNLVIWNHERWQLNAFFDQDQVYHGNKKKQSTHSWTLSLASLDGETFSH